MHPSRLVVVLLVACRAPVALAPDHIANIERGLRPAVEIRGEPVRYAIAARMREFKIPAVSIAVFEHDQLAWARAYGLADVGVPATPETRFQAGSISKSVNALAALEAVEDGTLALDAPINDALTSWKLPDNALTAVTPVTLRQLLSHTAGTSLSGFAGYVAGAPLPTIPQILDGAPPANSAPVRVDLAPGTRFRYSGGGTTIVQLALTDRTQQAYPALLARRVLDPLGMTHSTYEQPLPAALVPHAAAGFDASGTIIEGKRQVYPEMAAAGLWTTPSDLAVLFAEIARARAGRSRKISHAIAMQMTTKVADLGPGTSDAIALGTFLMERNGSGLAFFGHDGVDRGFQAEVLASLDGGYGIVVMANSNNGYRIFFEIERAICAEYGWQGAVAPVDRVALDAAQRARFVGRFRGEHDAIRSIADVAGKLVMQVSDSEPVELIPISARAAVERTSGARFELDAAGEVTLWELGEAAQRLVRLAD